MVTLLAPPRVEDPIVLDGPDGDFSIILDALLDLEIPDALFRYFYLLYDGLLL